MFSYFDVVVSVIVIITTLVSLTRGFLNDVLSVFVWIGSGVSTLYFFPYAATWMEDLFKSSVVVNIAAIVFVFLLSLAILGLFGAMISGGLKEYRNGLFDRILGAGFGFGKGFVIVSLIHLAIIEVAGKDEPDWLRGETYEYTSAGADWLRDFAKDVFEKGVEILEKDRKEPPSLDELKEGVTPDELPDEEIIQEGV